MTAFSMSTRPANLAGVEAAVSGPDGRPGGGYVLSGAGSSGSGWWVHLVLAL